MSYPTGKVHRVNRRKLGRGQYPQNLGTILLSVTPSTNSAILVFAKPVVYGGAGSGGIDFVVTGNSTISGTQNSPTQITVLTNSTVAGKAWKFAPNQTNIMTFQGGTVAGASGTFP